MATMAELLARALHLHQSGDLRQAEPLYLQILLADPNHADAHHLLGLVQYQTGHPEAAIKLLQRAIALNASAAPFHSNLGLVLKEQGQVAEAIQCYRQALLLHPQYANAQNNLGLALMEQGQHEEAIACFREALRLDPQFAVARSNLGNALAEQGQLGEAVECYREALRINPQDEDMHNNLGNALKDLGQLDEAAAYYEQALHLAPNHGAARRNRSFLWLLRGDMTRGWPDFEYRWQDPGIVPRTFAQPRWDGSALDGKTILLHAELGLGDTLQFIRYAALVKQRGGNVLFECPPPLLQLLEGVAGVDRLVAQGQPLPDFDVQIPLLSLPAIFQTTLETIPADIPYVKADPELVQSWREVLEPLGGFKVGLVWQGNPRYQDDRLRSIPLRYFEPLARVRGVRFVSLQKGPAAGQLRALGGDFPILDLGQRLETFGDTAAVLMNLDLLISSCTSVPHLAAALGLPVWLALPYAPDWRWLLERDDSPWYPHHRLFRQKRPGDWGEVFERIALALGGLIASRAAKSTEEGRGQHDAG